MSCDRLYERHSDYFGREPSPILVLYQGLLERDRPVLDIGAGQGRNAFFLARQGYLVVAIDASRAGIEYISKRALQEELLIQTHVCGFGGFRPRADYYSGILLLGVLQVIDRVSIEILIDRIGGWTASGSLVFVTAFTTSDPSFQVHAREAPEIGKNSYLVKGVWGEEIRTYLEAKELLQLFPGWEVVHYHEGVGPEHTHPGGEPERHGVVEAVLRR